jgi:hypothetical protein
MIIPARHNLRNWSRFIYITCDGPQNNISWAVAHDRYGPTVEPVVEQ